MTIRSQKDLEVALSRLKSFENPSWKLEQYPTPSPIAAEWIWNMALRREVAGRAFLDAGCGAGILGMGLLLMGARVAYFLDQDEQAMQICKDNYISLKKEYEIGEANFMVHDIQLFDGEVDIVAQNPPFGTKNEHADRKFLEKAFEVASVVYSMHKYSTKSFVEAMCKDYKFKSN